MDTNGIEEKASVEEFESWRSFWNFQQEIARDWRYVRSAEGQRFLAAVAAGSHARSAALPAGRRFYRAQVAYNDMFNAEVGEAIPGPALPERMRR